MRNIEKENIFSYLKTRLLIHRILYKYFGSQAPVIGILFSVARTIVAWLRIAFAAPSAMIDAVAGAATTAAIQQTNISITDILYNSANIRTDW